MATAALLALLQVLAEASEPSHAPSFETGHVDVYIVAGDNDHDRLRALSFHLRAVIQSSDWSLQVDSQTHLIEEVLKRPPPNANTNVQAWVDIRKPEEATLFFLDVAQERAAVRPFSMPHKLSDALLFEQVSQALRTLLDAVQAQEQVGEAVAQVRKSLGLDAPEAAAQNKAPVQNRAESEEAQLLSVGEKASAFSARAWDVDAGYAAYVVSPDVLLHAVAAGCTRWWRTSRWALGPRAELRYAFPSNFPAAPLSDGRIDVVSVRMGVAAALLTKRLQWETGADVGFDIVRVRVRPDQSSNFNPGDAGGGPIPITRLRLRASYAARAASPFIELSTDLEIIDLRYAIDDNGTRLRAFNPSSVRPAVAAGFVF